MRTWVEINLDNLRYNYNLLCNELPDGVSYMSVVKADAYGHGAVEIAKEYQRLGVTNFCVASIEEAIELRQNGIEGDILILGYTAVEQRNELLYHNLIQTICDEEYGSVLHLGSKEKIRVHVAIDTGMNRMGYDTMNTVECAQKIIELKNNYLVEGVFTHLCVADSDDANDIQYTEIQINKVIQVLDIIEKEGIVNNHFLNSAGGFRYKNIRSVFVRWGICQYGLIPYKNFPLELRPVLSWYSVVTRVKVVLKGETIGYGRTFTTERDSVIASLAVGYADGYPRYLSNKGVVLIHDQFAKIVGNVCMDQLMVDVTDITASVSMGDVAVLIGSSGQNSILADELAEQGKTINYEIVCGISKRVKRLYI